MKRKIRAEQPVDRLPVGSEDAQPAQVAHDRSIEVAPKGGLVLQERQALFLEENVAFDRCGGQAERQKVR